MIIRTEKNSHYTTICNDALNDPNLTLKAKGLWAFIMSKPDEWNVSSRGLETQLKEGRDAIMAALKELEIAGYLERGKKRMVNGKWSTGVNTLHEQPTVVGKSDHGLSDHGKAHHIVNTKQVNTKQDMFTKVNMGAKAPVTTFGTPEINSMFKVWADTTGLPIQRLAQRNRLACYSLLKSLGAERLTALIQSVEASKLDKYAPVITDFISLELKQGQLEAWQKRQVSSLPRPDDQMLARHLLHPEKYGRPAR